MNWEKLISSKRLGMEELYRENRIDDRSEFQRDYDRIIFCSPFRRLQNKTQVFPLPGSIFVHNRLTHTLEVASVGRSLGSILASKLIESGEADLNKVGEIGSVVGAACLAHDLGNPPFGHSGEDGISEFFTNGAGLQYQSLLDEKEWSDLTCFDGNANAFRILTHQFKGRRPGGFALTYSTLASIVKYPFESIEASPDKKKFGFFQSEKDIFLNVAHELGLIGVNEDPVRFNRHPLVYLVEAADDICYQVMDIEDAYKLKILSYEKTRDLFLNFYDESAEEAKIGRIKDILNRVTDPNEQIAFLRAGVINQLTNACSTIFWDNRTDILNGVFEGTLIKRLEGKLSLAMNQVQQLSFDQIYNHSSVVQIEIAGFRIMGTLMEELSQALMQPKLNYSKKLISLIPEQYLKVGATNYEKLQSVVDFVSGMTDLYALDLYRKLKGISVPGLRER
ncbi:MAG: dNTP triphosphohydrolase [Bacteroidota bacterium]|nr:dNTP triphosphohydrolase [Bacteroidota bacterium]MDP4205102.1 dNTP triphosphohydrolase [Bacteroidota bacterium]